MASIESQMARHVIDAAWPMAACRPWHHGAGTVSLENPFQVRLWLPQRCRPGTAVLVEALVAASSKSFPLGLRQPLGPGSQGPLLTASSRGSVCSGAAMCLQGKVGKSVSNATGHVCLQWHPVTQGDRPHKISSHVAVSYGIVSFKGPGPLCCLENMEEKTWKGPPMAPVSQPETCSTW